VRGLCSRARKGGKTAVRALPIATEQKHGFRSHTEKRQADRLPICPCILLLRRTTLQTRRGSKTTGKHSQRARPLDLVAQGTELRKRRGRLSTGGERGTWSGAINLAPPLKKRLGGVRGSFGEVSGKGLSWQHASARTTGAMIPKRSKNSRKLKPGQRKKRNAAKKNWVGEGGQHSPVLQRGKPEE